MPRTNIDASQILNGTIKSDDLADSSVSISKISMCRAKSVGSAYVFIEPGALRKSNGTGKVNFAGGNSPAFGVVGAGNARYDLLCINDDGNISILQGVESASPVPPTYPTDRNVIAEIFVNETSGVIISDADITDVRAILGTSASLPVGNNGDTLRYDGANWIANNLIFNNGTNVGIGTTNPGAALDVTKNVGTGSNAVLFNLTDSGSVLRTVAIGANPTRASFGMITNNDLGLGTNNDFSQLYLKAGGNVGIGTASPTRKFFVNGAAGGTTNWYNDSDERLKKNIKTIENALDKVLSLRGVSFEWKNTNNHPKGKQIGLIAQEAKEIIPEVVDKKGEYYSMQYAPLVSLLIEAIKEQQKEIEELKSKLSDIEKKGIF